MELSKFLLLSFNGYFGYAIKIINSTSNDGIKIRFINKSKYQLAGRRGLVALEPNIVITFIKTCNIYIYICMRVRIYYLFFFSPLLKWLFTCHCRVHLFAWLFPNRHFICPSFTCVPIGSDRFVLWFRKGYVSSGSQVVTSYRLTHTVGAFTVFLLVVPPATCARP